MSDPQNTRSELVRDTTPKQLVGLFKSLGGPPTPHLSDLFVPWLYSEG
jgi:hypothetical protein